MAVCGAGWGLGQAGLLPPGSLSSTLRPGWGSEGFLGGGTPGLGRVWECVWLHAPAPEPRTPPPPPRHPALRAGRAQGRLRPGPLTFRQSWGCVSTSGYCTCGGSSQAPPSTPSPDPAWGYSPCRVPAGRSAPGCGRGPLAPGASTGSRDHSRDRQAPSSGPGPPAGSGWRPTGPLSLQGPSPRGSSQRSPRPRVCASRSRAESGQPSSAPRTAALRTLAFAREPGRRACIRVHRARASAPGAHALAHPRVYSQTATRRGLPGTHLWLHAVHGRLMGARGLSARCLPTASPSG